MLRSETRILTTHTGSLPRPAELTRLYASRVRGQPVDEAVLAAIPRSYVVTTGDRSLPPALQRRMIREHQCSRVVELDAGHAPYLSAPAELAAALSELAESAAELV